MERRPVRIANFSGALGDHVGAFAEAIRGEPVDFAVGDYLAEITMALVAAGLASKPGALRGFYIDLFLKQLAPELSRVAEKKIKIVVNAGAFHPEGLANAVKKEIAAQGLSLSVAHVRGDDVFPRLRELTASGQMQHLDSGEALGDLEGRLMAANAYLGAWGIAAALREGAGIVITGRVTDASLVVGPAAYWHDWKPTDFDRLAGAVAAGHIIECGPQATGGNFSGFTELPRDLRLGFPIAEIAGDGSTVITKRAGEGGAVTVDTVKAQLVYEIQGPRYLNPDVVLHVDTVQVTQAGKDRVQVSGAKGSPPPDTTKVGAFYQNGFRMALFAYAAGLDIDAKTSWFRAQMESVCEALPLDAYEIAVLGRPADDPRSLAEATVAIRVGAAAQTAETLQRISAGFASFGLGGMPGYTGEITFGSVSPRIDYWPGVVRQDVLRHEVVLDDGRVLPIALPETAPFPGQPAPSPSDGLPKPAGDLVRVPLGRLVHARSGDKGGNSNLGVWARDPRSWPFIADLLTAAEVARLLHVPPGCEVERYELPNIHGLVFVLNRYFGESGSGNIGLDQIGKATGEHLRARVVEVPASLL